MKKRIQIDVTLLLIVIIGTMVLMKAENFYLKNRIWDDISDFLGMILILKGNFIRMSARGFKKNRSLEGEMLVTEGPYKLTRNPMYLGSFMIGVGFVLILWPWWMWSLFALVFYVRFRRQIELEERYLFSHFGSPFEQYRKKVPQIFPRWSAVWRLRVKETFPWGTLWITKEKWGFISWPLLAFILEALQELLVFGSFDFEIALCVFGAAMVTFFLMKGIEYKIG